ncbi:hypothetical protein N9Y60_00710 [Crocinitomicaceae bacterium]|nr:hypothetical protein [Crocinitomicaceae bacterium]
MYLLAKRFDKSIGTYSAIALAIYLVGGSILAFVVTTILLLMRGNGFIINMELTYLAFPLTGVVAVGICYWFLLWKWKKEKKATPSNTEILDDSL